MKVLIVNYMYAPAINPRAFRWTAIAEHWARKGHEVHVVCAWQRGLVREEVRKGVTVRRTGGWMREGFRKLLGSPALLGRPAPLDAAGAQAGATRSAARSAGGIAGGLPQRTWRRLYWPDAYCPWFPSALSAARRAIAQLRPDALVTVSLPFTSHLVGLNALRGREGLRWLVDIGDPFSFLRDTPPNNHALYEGLNRSFERRVLVGARVGAVTTEGTLERYEEAFPEARGKLRVVPPLVSRPESSADGPPFFPEDGRVRLLYVGTLYRKIRSPRFLLDLFDRLSESRAGTELHIIGDVHDCGDLFRESRAMREGRVRLHGVVDRGAAFRAMRGATALVNIGNDTPFQLPSKVVEYAHARRPVVNLIRGADDSSREFFRPHPACLEVVQDGEPSAEQALALAAFLERWSGRTVEVDEGWLSRFGTERIADAYEELLWSC